MTSVSDLKHERASEQALVLAEASHAKRLFAITEAEQLIARAVVLLNGVDSRLCADLAPLASEVISDARAISAELRDKECRL